MKVGRAAVQANPNDPAGTDGTAGVDDRAREFERGKKALIEHALDASTKDHSPERGRKAEKEIGKRQACLRIK